MSPPEQPIDASDETRPYVRHVRGDLAGVTVGRYSVEKLIGQGGMGEVYLGRHASLERQVAIKVLSGQFSGNPEWVARFRREAKILATLDHPNAVRVYDYGQHEDREYLVMEYVEGKDLSQVIKQRGKMRVVDALAIAKRVCNALHAAHSLGVVHRDIKPGNILITHEKVKVADFGLSSAQHNSDTTTQPGRILGTPNYMSPEQCKGASVDGRSDLYSLGASLYHMLSGRQPHTAEQPLAILRMHIDEKVTPTPLSALNEQVPAAVEQLVRRLMAKRREDRYASAHEASVEIDAVLRAVRGAPRPRTRTVTPWLLYGTVAAAAAVGLFFAAWLNRTPPEAAPTPQQDTASSQPDPASLALEDARKAAATTSPDLSKLETLLAKIAKEHPSVASSELGKIRKTAREGALRARARVFHQLLKTQFTGQISPRRWRPLMPFIAEKTKNNARPEQLVRQFRPLPIRREISGWQLGTIEIQALGLDDSARNGWVEAVYRSSKNGEHQTVRYKDSWVLVKQVWYWSGRRRLRRD